jgi:hypothetical protein
LISGSTRLSVVVSLPLDDAAAALMLIDNLAANYVEFMPILRVCADVRAQLAARGATFSVDPPVFTIGVSEIGGPAGIS